MGKRNKLDFGDQHIYVGMDVHKKSWNVSIHTEQFERKTFTQSPDIEKLTYYLQRTFPEED
jgi:transposase